MNRISRRTRRVGAAIVVGAGFGLAAPHLPVFGQVSPTDQCQQAILAAQSNIAQFSNVAQVSSQVIAINSYLLQLQSQVCGSLPTTTSTTNTTVSPP